MNKKIALVIVSSILMLPTLVGCNRDPSTPTPEPTPTYPIDFDINPSSDNNITVNKGSQRTISIAFKDSSYKSNVKSIKWTLTSDYISKKSISSDNMSFTFNADDVTPDSEPGILNVKITSIKNEVKEKTCYIDVRVLPIEEDLIWDNLYYTHKEEGTFRKGIQYIFTTTPTSFLKYTYFGMSNHAGTSPYFSIGYNDNNKKVNVTSISISNTSGTSVLTSNDFYVYSREQLIVFKENLLKSGDSIIVKCTINETVNTGFWAYVGNSN